MSTHGIHEDLLFLSGWRMLRKLKAWGFLAVPKYRLIMFLFFSYMSSTTTTSVVYPYPPQATPTSAMSLEGFKLSIAILACYLGTIGKLHTSLSECLYCKKSHGMLNSRFYTDTFPRKQAAKKLKAYPELVPSKESMCGYVTFPVTMIMMPRCPLLSRSKTLTLAKSQHSERPARLGWWNLNYLWRQTNQQTNKQSNKQTNKPTNKQTNKPTNKPTNKQTTSMYPYSGSLKWCTRSPGDG